jgi:hypothetical protein
MVLSYLWLIHHVWLRHVFTEERKPAVHTKVVMLGGGFGGLYSALHFGKTIASDPTVDMILVSRENYILFTPMLHEVAAGDLALSDIVSPLRQMLQKRALSAGGRAGHCDRPTTSRIRWRRGATLPAVIAGLLTAP